MIKRATTKSSGNNQFGRRSFIFSSALGIGGTLIAAPFPGAALGKNELKTDLLQVLKDAGVPEASQALGINFGETFGSLDGKSHHIYLRYRWSVSYSVTGSPLIQALPPEEEMGWLPWEEWYSLNGKPVRRAMVLYPVKEMTRNVPIWWVLEQSSIELFPRDSIAPRTIEELFRRNRVYEAANAVGFDAQKLIIEPLSFNAKEIYLRMRWTVAPHRLAADLPVIQCLPPVDKLNEWPWETWYTDGKTPLIHHVHYTKPTGHTAPKSWKERDGAPQRPFELFRHEWYWYNDDSFTPALGRAI